MALPIDFITRTRALLGEEYDHFESALQADVPVSIRINQQKGTKSPQNGLPVAWCKNGFYLPERLSFTFDPLFHAGAYYVQEASSMFLEQAIKTYVKGPVRCLDLCAAPGGKSTHLASLLPEGSLLVSNEVIRSRSYVLAENIAKWGKPESIVLNNDPEEIGTALTHLFDVIVTDVPCSGEGMFRKDTDSTGEWSVDNVKLCAARQRRIIHDIWSALKPGGLLIYSTCTYNLEENEDNIQYIIQELGAKSLAIPTQEEWKVTNALKYNNPCYHFFPHKTKGEGFFLAALRKSDGEIEEIHIKTKSKKGQGKAASTISKEQLNISRKQNNYIREQNDFNFEWKENRLYAYPNAHAEVISIIQNKKLRILSAGICIGELKGKDLIPSQELALSTALNPEAFSSVNLDWEDAIKYLKKEALVLPEGTTKGYILLRYKNLPLGFVKNLGNRANNLYPQEWRIRSGYLPEEIRLYE